MSIIIKNKQSFCNNKLPTVKLGNTDVIYNQLCDSEKKLPDEERNARFLILYDAWNLKDHDDLTKENFFDLCDQNCGVISIATKEQLYGLPYPKNFIINVVRFFSPNFSAVKKFCESFPEIKKLCEEECAENCNIVFDKKYYVK